MFFDTWYIYTKQTATLGKMCFLDSQLGYTAQVSVG